MNEAQLQARRITDTEQQELRFFRRIYSFMNTKIRTILITIVAIGILTVIRLLWIAHVAPAEHPVAEKGRLDLRDWDFSTERSLALDGEWEFYPYTFLIDDSLPRTAPLMEQSYVRVPQNWRTYIDEEGRFAYGYGSYRLKIAIDPTKNQTYSIHVPNTYTSSAVFVNGQRVNGRGTPAKNKAAYTPSNSPYNANFAVDTEEIDLIIQVANYVKTNKGGIVESLRFSSTSTIKDEVRFRTNMQILVAILLLFHLLYAVLLLIIGMRQRTIVYFIGLMVAGLMMLVVVDDQLLLDWIPLSYVWVVKIASIASLAGSLFTMQLALQLTKSDASHILYRVVTYAEIVMIASYFVLPISAIFYLQIVSYIFFFTPYTIGLYVMLRFALRGGEGGIFLLLAIVSIVLNVFWSIAKHSIWLNLQFYPVDLIVSVATFSAFLLHQHLLTNRESQALTAELQKADKQKDAFLASTSHELRNPLHGMMNIAQAVRESKDSALSSNDKKNIDLLLAVGKRMTVLLNDLLDLTRLQEKGIHLHIQAVRLQATVTGVLDMLAFLIEQKPVRIDHRIPAHFPPIAADENRLQQIVFNVLHNAIKFTERGTIVIRAEAIEDMAHVHIEDTGIGIEPELLERIFLPYEQGNTTTAIIGEGMGLGLSITRHLVEMHGGTIEVQSVIGQGTKLSFTIPLAEQHVVEIGNNDAAGVSIDDSTIHSTLRMPVHANEGFAVTDGTVPTLIDDPISILVVDDDPVNLNVLKQLLATDGYEVITARGGHGALALLKTREWDLIIADVMMPHMSGYDLTRKVRESFTRSELPILLLTARAQTADMEAGFFSGANDYVTKPMDALELRARVRSLTELRRSLRERLRIETAFLHAQIQPHFLFNTLNSIAALSDIDQTRMRRLIAEFGNYLHSSFDFHNLDRLVPMEHELEIVRSYVYIEKVRFEERLQVHWEVDENLSCQVPPLSIQPIVENAVKHGVLARLEGGHVVIRIHDKGDYVEVQIRDDGVGIAPERLSKLLTGAFVEGVGIGLYNADRRLKQIFGAGLSIESEIGKGTTVSFRVPNIVPNL